MPDTREQRQARVTGRIYKSFISEYVVGVVKYDTKYMTDICVHCGALHWIEERVHRSSEYESCCKRGDVKLDPLRPSPPLLQDLLIAKDSVGRHYRKHSRQYNSALAFTSVNYRADTRVTLKAKGLILS